MKLVNFILLISTLTLSPSLNSTDILKIDLKSISSLIKQKNYLIQQEAEVVYQSKLKIEESRRNLLPSLNLWNLGKVLIDPLSILDLIPDIAPFLVPANWLRLEQNKILYISEKEAYRALVANELLNGRAYFIKLGSDFETLKTTESILTELTKIHNIASQRFAFGSETPETVQNLELLKLKATEDIEKLNILLAEEISTLNFMMGIPIPTAPYLIFPTDLPPQPQLDLSKILYRTHSTSPELRQYDQLLNMIPLLKDEVKYNFLGISESSRGVGGGIFDSLMPSKGLGFNNSTSLSLIESQKNLISLQRIALKEILTRDVYRIIPALQSQFSILKISQQSQAINQKLYMSALSKLSFGGKVDLLQLADLAIKKAQSELSTQMITNEIWLLYDRLSRLLMIQDYDLSPGIIAEIPGANK